MAIEHLKLPKNYKSSLNGLQTQKAIKLLKDTFESKLAYNLSLTRVSAPLFVDAQSGLNDNLNGTERPVSFDIKELGNQVEIVHSLAKWKRMALKSYGFNEGEGLYTDMNAIRRDEDLDNLHSVYVDQWDWEKMISRQDRTIDYLKTTVTKIVCALKETEDVLCQQYPQLLATINPNVYFITSQELEDLYPKLDSKQRENAITKEYRTVFIMQIGSVLNSGLKHDGRAPDYDDWNLNGDILIYDDLLDCAMEISSMGIRVDECSLLKQLEKANCIERSLFPFHQQLLSGNLPITMGGGIGQSRICMLLLKKAHIGEVQVSSWSDTMIKICRDNDIILL